MSQFKIGLTGGIGSGKTLIANLFAEQGVQLVDADIIAREVIEPGTTALAELAAHFGAEILDPSGNLDRKALRQRVFANPLEKDWLNKLLHPLIHHELVRQAKACSSPYCLLVVPLLVENKLQGLVDRLLVIDVPEAIQIQRVTQRDQCDAAHVQAILASQASRQQRLDAADDVIENIHSLEKMRDEVINLHRFYLTLAGQ